MVTRIRNRPEVGKDGLRDRLRSRHNRIETRKHLANPLVGTVRCRKPHWPHNPRLPHILRGLQARIAQMCTPDSSRTYSPDH